VKRENHSLHASVRVLEKAASIQRQSHEREAQEHDQLVQSLRQQLANAKANTTLQINPASSTPNEPYREVQAKCMAAESRLREQSEKCTTQAVEISQLKQELKQRSSGEEAATARVGELELEVEAVRRRAAATAGENSQQHEEWQTRLEEAGVAAREGYSQLRSALEDAERARPHSGVGLLLDTGSPNKDSNPSREATAGAVGGGKTAFTPAPAYHPPRGTRRPHSAFPVSGGRNALPIAGVISSTRSREGRSRGSRPSSITIYGHITLDSTPCRSV